MLNGRRAASAMAAADNDTATLTARLLAGDRGALARVVTRLERDGHYALTTDDKPYDILLEDVILKTEDLPGWKSATDNVLTVALDVHLTPELLAEGTARDLVNRIQNIRKERNFNVTDRVTVTLERHPAIVPAVEGFKDYIKREVLATDLVMTETWPGEQVELNDEVALGIGVEVL